MSWKGFLPESAVVMVKKGKKPPSPPLIEPQTNPLPTYASPGALPEIAADLAGCPRCKLCKDRTHIVFGEGNAKARLMFVGEAPGEQEDREGRPFVGRSGQLLTKMIEGMGLKREDVFIANVVKCRPPENRNPEPDEISACSPFLFRQIDTIRPEVIVALGKFAAQTLLATEETISNLRGRTFPFRGAQLIPTFHPAYLLRNPPAKKDAWEDLKLALKELKLPLPSAKSPP